MDSSVKAITALLGLLTAMVVLFGAATDQGWLPSFIKDPAQSALPGQQQGEAVTGGGTDGGGTPRETAPPPSKTSGPFGPDTCIQGYVWREAIPGDHVCVTPETRDLAREDNQLANDDSRRSPTGGDYGPDTCVQGYVWRGVVPSDHVCVTPETRDQVQQDNALADSRRAG
jgi:hypothetical protein